MLVHDGFSNTSELSRWLGPLSPAFMAMASADEPAGPGHQAGAGWSGATGGDRPGTVSTTVVNGMARTGALPADATAGQMATAAPSAAAGSPSPEENAELRSLFHTLNNQLGVILTYAELLEAKATDDAQRKRAEQVVTAALEALGTTKQIRAGLIR